MAIIMIIICDILLCIGLNPVCLTNDENESPLLCLPPMYECILTGLVPTDSTVGRGVGTMATNPERQMTLRVSKPAHLQIAKDSKKNHGNKRSSDGGYLRVAPQHTV